MLIPLNTAAVLLSADVPIYLPPAKARAMNVEDESTSSRNVFLDYTNSELKVFPLTLSVHFLGRLKFRGEKFVGKFLLRVFPGVFKAYVES